MPNHLASLPRRSTLPPPPTEIAARFDIEVDADRRLIRYTLAGFFHAAAVADAKARQAEAMRALGGPANRHMTLLDISRCRIQSQAMMQQFAAMLGDPLYRSRAMAVVVGASLARTQIGRILDRPGVAFFATVADAEAWLLAGAAAQPAPTPTASPTEAKPSRASSASSSPSMREGSPGPA